MWIFQAVPCAPCLRWSGRITAVKQRAAQRGSLFGTTKLESQSALPVKTHSHSTTSRHLWKRKKKSAFYTLVKRGRAWSLTPLSGRTSLWIPPFFKLGWELVSRKPCLTISQKLPWVRGAVRGKRSTQSVPSCLSAWVGVNLFCLWQL